MKLILEEHDSIDITSDLGDEDVLQIEKPQNFEIHINKRFRDIVKINYYEKD